LERRTTVNDSIKRVLNDVQREVERAEVKHGDQFHLPVIVEGEGSTKKYASLADRQKAFIAKMGRAGATITWQDIALEEVFETFAETEPARIRAEALQAAAMFVQIARRCDVELEKIDG
jgi:hypothetical protein